MSEGVEELKRLPEVIRNLGVAMRGASEALREFGEVYGAAVDQELARRRQARERGTKA